MSSDSLLGGIPENVQVPTYDDDKAAAYLCNWAYDYYNGIRVTKEYDGWTICEDSFIRDKLGCKFRLVVKSSDFQSLLFTKQKNNGYTYYAYCTVGTNSLKDWFTANLLQGFIGLSPQYTRSVQNAKELHDFAIKHKAVLWFIGHSLGGGLASNNSIITGRYAITFDAAGLNIMRVKMSLLMNIFYNNRAKVLFKFERKEKIHAYILRGEILNRIMQCFFEKAYGLKGDQYIIRPQIKEIQNKSSREKHDLDCLIKELELYKSNDEYLKRVVYNNYERSTD